MTVAERALPRHFFKLLIGLLLTLTVGVLIFAVSVSTPVPAEQAEANILPSEGNVQVNVSASGEMLEPPKESANP